VTADPDAAVVPTVRIVTTDPGTESLADQRKPGSGKVLAEQAGNATERPPAARWSAFGRAPKSLRGATVNALVALGIYIVASVVFFGLPVLGHFTTTAIGDGGDGPQFMWFLNWWPYALTHGLNPFIAKVVWAPIGANLTWATAIPGPSLVLAPITLTLGPVVSYNVLMLLAPATAAFCAFLLVRRLTGSWLAGLSGGWIFGLSSAMIGQELGHPHITLVFALPLLGYVLVCAFQARWPLWRAAAVSALLLTVQFLISPEYFADFAVFACLGWLLALWLNPPERRRVRRLGLALLGGYLLTAVAMSPFLYYMALGPIPPQPIHTPADWSTDLVDVVFPTPITLIGGASFTALSKNFLGNGAENGEYMGVPLLIILALYAGHQASNPWRRVLSLALVLIALCSLGPVLHVAGAATIPLPWALVDRLPLLQDAQPDRFVTFASLLAAIAVGRWLIERPDGARAGDAVIRFAPRGGDGLAAGRLRRRHLKIAWVLLAILFLLPTWDVRQRRYWSDVQPAVPSFFATGAVHRYLHPGENVVIFPFSNAGALMADQALSGMSFTMSNGYVGDWLPPAFRDWSIVRRFQAGQYEIGPDGVREFEAYLGAYRVEEVIAADPVPAQLTTDLQQAGLQAGATVGGVTLYAVPRQLWTTYEGATAESVQSGLLSEQFDALYHAAGRALLADSNRADIYPARLEAAGLLPDDYGGRSPESNWTTDNGWLGPWKDGVGVGVVGSWADVAPIVQRYRARATEIYFPYPDHLAGTPAGATRGELLMVFAPDTVRPAATTTPVAPVATTTPIPPTATSLPSLTAPVPRVRPIPTATASVTAKPLLPTAVPPPTVAPSPTPGGPLVYTVQPGDSLATIAARFHVSPQALAAQNRVTDPNRVLAGQQFTIPGPNGP
jgi:LysM repeat protein